MKRVIWAVMVVGTLGWGFNALAQNDLTLMSGLYQGSSTKVDGDEAGSSNKIVLGARLGQAIDSHYAWFGGGSFGLQTYSTPKGVKSPDNAFALTAEGGMRVLYPSGSWEPYLFGGGILKSSSEVTFLGSGWTQVETTGLYAMAGVGTRYNLEQGFFVEFELNGFESALFATETTGVYSAAADEVVKTAETKTGLYLQSYANIASTRVGLGMKF
jgi:hypothetical protein